MVARSSTEILAQLDDPTEIPRESARILLGHRSLRDRHKRLDAEWQQAVEDDAKLNRTPVAPRLAREIEVLEAEIEAAKDEFVFQSIGKRAWVDLLAEHPPTKEQRRSDNRLDHNPVTFPPAAMAASCIQPGMTVAEAAGYAKKLNSTQFDIIWYACIQANVGSADTPKSMAAGVIRRVNGRSANTAVPVDSLAASSSDE